MRLSVAGCRPASSLLRLLTCAAALLAVAAPPAPGRTAAASESRCFAATGQCARGRFLAAWEAGGGLPVNGYPLTGEVLEALEDGTVYTVQYFERARLEWHPENAPPYDVLLGQFGRRLHPADPPAAARPDRAYFPATGHNLGGAFRAYWEANGGLARFGYPISEELAERLEDGREYTVQYFERARFEHHPENADPHYQVLLGQFGRAIAGQRRPVPLDCPPLAFAAFPRLALPAELPWASHQIVTGTVVERLPTIAYAPDPAARPGYRELRTDYAIQVDGRVRGQPFALIHLRRAGGTVDGCTTAYQSEPEPVVGQRLLLFLATPQRGTGVPTYAAFGAQGYWDLTAAGAATNPLPHYRDHSGLPLPRLIEAVRAALADPPPTTLGPLLVPLDEAPLAPAAAAP
jgi:hypothetical protein